jgi:aspartate racemase
MKNDIKRREALSLIFSGGLISLPWLNGFGKTVIDHSNDQFLNNMNKPLNSKEMRTIGILGGLGPQATMDIEKRIHDVSSKLIASDGNSGYPPMIVQYYRHPPVLLTAEQRPVMPFQPDPRFLEAAKTLGKVSDFLIIASNGIHVFQKEVEQASGRKVISMIDATLEEVKRRGWKKVGALGLMNAKIYTARLESLGIAYETIDNDLQEKLNRSIFKTMEGREDANDRAVALEAIDQLRRKKVDGIILGCTEIPLLLGEKMNAPDLLNPAQFLAEAAVQYAIG